MIDADVTVVGGGPAGCAAALALCRAGITVLLVEKAQEQRERFGETLPPGGHPILAGLGLWERFIGQNHVRSFVLRSAWGQNALYENDFTFHPYGPWWHLNRKSFDSMLVAAAEEEGANILRGSWLRKARKSNSEPWRLEINCGGEAHHITSSFVVDATGRSALVARRSGALRRTYDSLVGLVGFMDTPPTASSAESHMLIEAAEGGWWYSAPLPKNRIVAAFMTDPDLIPRDSMLLSSFWREHLEETSHTWSRLRTATLTSGPYATLARTAALQKVCGTGWVAVGDAAASFDPLSSQGICNALESGYSAGNAVCQVLDGHEDALTDYAHGIERTFKEYLRNRALYYGRERRWMESPFWQRRQAYQFGQ